MDYDISDIFDPASPHYNGAVNLSMPPGAVNTFTGQTNPAAVGSGEMQGDTTVQDGFLQSSNFVTGVAGWKLWASGLIEAMGAQINGVITAISGVIGGWTINATSIFTGTEDHSGYTANAGDLTIYSNGTDASIHANKVYIDSAGVLNATGATISGTVTIGAGSSGVANLSDAGALATLDMIDVNTNAITNGAGWTDDTVANLKRRNFTVTPTTPYNVGDLWSGLSSGDLKVCTTQRLTGAYTAGDWVLASKYTDDSGVTTIVGNTVTTGFVNALNVTAASMNVGGLLAGTISSKSIVLGITGGTGDVEIRAGIATGDFANAGAASGFIIGLDDSDSDKAKLYFGDPTTYLKWDGAGLTVAGALTATVGSSIGSSYLSGAIPQANLNIADRGWSQTCAFSVTDADTIAWAIGTFTSADGTAYSIGAGNTGNMAAKTYIYLDIAVSTTAYQTTTTATTAVGVGKVLVAIAQNAAVEATFMTMQGQGGLNIDAANIVAGSITANEIAATTITSAKMNVSQLSAITADLGAITAGTITLPVTGYILGGQTDYNTGTGFFLGYSGAAYKLSIGNPSTKYLTWDGTALTINGYVQTNIGVFGGDGSDGALAISSGTTTLDLGGVANFTKNYSSISITGTGKLAFSNPHANGTVITLKSQGVVTLTSSTAPMIDCTNTGSAGGTTTVSHTGENHDGTNGTTATKLWLFSGGAGGKGVAGSGGAAGTSGATPTWTSITTSATLKYPNSFLGNGGGGGASINADAAGSVTAGIGGRGGGCLIIECGGALNFTTASGISVAGSVGGTGTITGVTTGGCLAQGGGGGSGGYCSLLYNVLTAASGTIASGGGAGGAGAINGSPVSPEGSGGGGGSPNGAGGAGTSGTTVQTGGSGATGFSLMAINQ